MWIKRPWLGWRRDGVGVRDRHDYLAHNRAAVAAGGDVQASVAGDESTNTLANDVEAYVADAAR